MKLDMAMKYNRRIFPLYKGIGWDPLFYSAIIFLFLTETKGIDPAKVMYAESFYALFSVLFQIPATILIEKIGNRLSLVLGCALITAQTTLMLFSNNFIYLIIAYSMSAFGNAIKNIAQYTLLYDATKICKGKNSFGSLDAQGSSLSYIIQAITSLFTGFLFVINAYLPLILSSLVSLLTVILSYRFEEVTIKKKEKTTILESLNDFKQGFQFIFKSKRLRALFIFICFFVGILMMISTYETSLQKDLQISPEYFGIIYAFFILVQCFSVHYQDKIHNTFKNKTLAFLSVPMFISFILVGIVTSLNLNYIFTIIFVLFAFFIQHFLRAPYWVLQNRYVTNFTNDSIRAKIISTSNLITGIGRIIMSCLGGLLLEFYSTSQAYLILGSIGLLVILLILNYMKKRFGLNPNMYDKEDIEYIKQ